MSVTVIHTEKNSKNYQYRYIVPDGAFIDTGNPTDLEAKTWGDANLSEALRLSGTILILPGAGDNDNPQFVWMYLNSDITDPTSVLVRIKE